MPLTENQIERVKKDWQRSAKDEPIEVEAKGGAIYAFGSELACLRLAYKYRRSDSNKVHAAYSENLKTWFFSLEVNL